jgi:DNA repair exonuclease SbcCD ATPase subunit
MKIAEALVQRADCQTLIQSLAERIKLLVLLVEGETPVESPDQLIEELDRAIDRLEELVAKINRTNARTEVRPGVTITDLIAHRDSCKKRHLTLTEIAAAAMPAKRDRMGRIEKAIVKAAISVPELRVKISEASKAYRAVDAEIQQLNWQVDIIE